MFLMVVLYVAVGSDGRPVGARVGWFRGGSLVGVRCEVGPFSCPRSGAVPSGIRWSRSTDVKDFGGG